MVYYFETRDGHLVYIGKDKYENEDLIKYGWPEDIWFHADDHSSAHIYLRLKEGETFETIPKIALEDCC
jgi:predicted ribosome quality control (RQC) complex YloA/Tae2 family protein